MAQESGIFQPSLLLRASQCWDHSVRYPCPQPVGPGPWTFALPAISQECSSSQRLPPALSRGPRPERRRTAAYLCALRRQLPSLPVCPSAGSRSLYLTRSRPPKKTSLFNKDRGRATLGVKSATFIRSKGTVQAVDTKGWKLARYARILPSSENYCYCQLSLMILLLSLRRLRAL